MRRRAGGGEVTDGGVPATGLFRRDAAATSLMSVRKYNNLFGYHHEYSNRPYTSGQEWYEQVLKLRTWYVMVYFVPVMYLYSYIP